MADGEAVTRFLFALLAAGVAGSALAADLSELILARAGNLPILLTAPHGGDKSVPGVPPRSRGTTGTDTHTLEIAQELHAQLAKRLGAQPYLVAARFSRKYIDANRAEAEAIESPAAKPAYEAYHGRIRQFVAEIRQKFPKGGVLIDLHGQAEEPFVLHRGTRNGRTVAALLEKHGPDALTGPKSILGVVASRRYKVFPPPGAPIGNPEEDRRYNGGHTVATYRSRGGEGLDAIQLELGSILRTDRSFTPVLADAIAVFYRSYFE